MYVIRKLVLSFLLSCHNNNHFSPFSLLVTLGPTPPNTCDDKDTTACDNGRRCYGKEEQCNGVPDCKDGADEKGCPSTTLPATTRMFLFVFETVHHLVSEITFH